MSHQRVRIRKATFQVSSFDPESGTFTAVAATETPVPRVSYSQGEYSEVLSLSRSAVRMDRLQSGRAPLLDAHRSGSSRDQIGVITDARIADRQLIIEGKLSRREDVQPIADDIADGIVRNVSVGYVSHRHTESIGPDGLTITRTDWEPIEVSIVSAGADPNAHIRASQGTIMRNKRSLGSSRRAASSSTSTDLVDDDFVDAIDALDGHDRSDLPSGSAQPVRLPLSRREVALARSSVAAIGLDENFANRCIADGLSLSQIRDAAQDEWVRRSPARQLPQHSIDTRPPEGDTELNQAIGDALYGRMVGKAPEGRARELMGRTILELGTIHLEARGERINWKSREQLAAQIMTRMGGLHSTSDFPSLLSAAGERVLIDAYKANQTPLKQLARRRDANDFRALSALKLSEAPKLVEVIEGGQIKYGSRGEAKESFRVKTYARIFGLTRQALINDDLGAFSDSNRAFGAAAAQSEADQLVSLFTANSGNGVTLEEGGVLYSTGRGNKAASGTVIDETNMSIARTALRQVKGLDGVTPLGLTAKHLVVGPAKETEGEKLITAIQAAAAANVNPFAGKIELHVEPRFAGNAWRLFADPAVLPCISIAYLSGQEGPQVDVKEGWDVLGTEFRCVLDFGCGITEWRGTYLNPGN